MDFPGKLVFFASCMRFVNKIPEIREHITDDTIKHFVQGVRMMEAEIMDDLPGYIEDMETIGKIHNKYEGTSSGESITREKPPLLSVKKAFSIRGEINIK